MTNQLAFSFLWCAAQVLIVTLVALIVSLTTMKRRPELVSRITSSAVMISLCLTMLIPFSIPRSWLDVATRFSPASLPWIQDRDLVVTAHSTGPTPSDEARDNQGQLWLSPAKLMSRLVVANRNAGPQTNGLPSISLLMICLGTGISFGLMRLIVGLFALHLLMRRSRKIEDPGLIALARELASQEGVSESIKLAESDEVGSAALVGYLRPSIVISPEWRDWTEHQRRAVLSHELAHQVRHDSFWRLVATISVAIHFYNPLIRWLSRRFVLAQELSADRLAGRLAGDATAYLKSLTQLALNEDSTSNGRTWMSGIPVFSGDLIRRIEMLRVMDGGKNQSSGSKFSTFVIGALIAFGTITMLMRGLADANSDGQKSPKPKDQAAPAQVSQTSVADAGYFHRNKISPTHPAFNRSGGIFIDVAALRQTWIWPMLMFLTKDEPGRSIAKHWNFNAFESVAADFKMNIVERQGDQQGMFGVGMGRYRMTFSKEVIWKEAIKILDPNMVEVSIDEKLMFQTDYAGFPGAMLMFPVSQFELAGSFQKRETRDDSSTWLNPSEADRQHSWADEWNAVAGGMITAVATKKTSDKPVTDQDFPGIEDANLLHRSIELVSIGIDVQGKSEKVGIRLRLAYKDSCNPDALISALRNLINCSLDDDQDDDPVTAAVVHQTKKMLADGMATAKTNVIRGPQNVLEIQMEWTLPAEWIEFAAQAEKELAAAL